MRNEPLEVGVSAQDSSRTLDCKLTGRRIVVRVLATSR